MISDSLDNQSLKISSAFESAHLDKNPMGFLSSGVKPVIANISLVKVLIPMNDLFPITTGYNEISMYGTHERLLSLILD